MYWKLQSLQSYYTCPLTACAGLFCDHSRRFSFSFQTSNQLTDASSAWKSAGGSVLLKLTGFWRFSAAELYSLKITERGGKKISHSLSKLASKNILPCINNNKGIASWATTPHQSFSRVLHFLHIFSSKDLLIQRFSFSVWTGTLETQDVCVSAEAPRKFYSVGNLINWFWWWFSFP